MKNSRPTVLFLSVFSAIWCVAATHLSSQPSRSLASFDEAVCEAVLTVPSNFASLQQLQEMGANLNCHCLVRQKTKFVSMGQTFVSFYNTTIPEHLLEADNDTEAFTETLYATPLYIALNREDYPLLRFLLQNGLDLNTYRIGEGNLLPLEFALYSNREKLMNFLLKMGANPNIVQVRCPYDRRLLRKIIELGADPNTIDLGCVLGNPDRLTAALELMTDLSKVEFSENQFQILLKYPKTFERLLEKGLDINRHLTAHADGDDFHKTYLMRTIELNNEAMFSLLLKYGASVNAIDKNGYTPLFYALLTRNFKFAERLLKAGAFPNWTAGDGKTPVTILLQNNDNAFLELFLKHNANPHQNLPLGGTPFLVALQKDQRTAAALMMEYVPIQLNLLDCYAVETLLHDPEKLEFALAIGLRHPNADLLKKACQEKQHDLINVLLEQKTVSQSLDTDHPLTAPLYDAVQKDNAPLAIQWLKAGANPNHRLFNQPPLLHLAVQNENIVLAYQLLKHGADGLAQDSTQRDALAIAVEKRHIEMVQMMVETFDLPVFCENVAVAIEGGSLVLLKLLLKHHPDWANCQFGGKSPLQYARQKDASPSIQLFLDRF